MEYASCQAPASGYAAFRVPEAAAGLRPGPVGTLSFTVFTSLPQPHLSARGTSPARNEGFDLEESADMTAAVPDRPAPRREDLVKVWFKFAPREDWLPYDTEGLWAELVDADTARVANVPFLQDGVAEGDVVRFTVLEDGLRYSTGRVEASGNCTVRVLPDPSGPLGSSAAAVRERIAHFGLGGEVFSAELPLVAFTVPADADLPAIKRLLEQGQADGWWHYETGCVTQAWRDA